MSDDSLNNPSRGERQRRRRKRASRNLEEFGDANLSASAPVSKGRGLALQDLPNQKTPGQVKNPSSGNSNSLELNDERKTKSRRSRKRAPRQENEDGEHSMERRGHRRPPKHRMNRSVSEEVLDIQREMNDAHQGIRRMTNTSRNIQGNVNGIPRNERDPGTVKPSGHTRPHKPKRNKTKERLSRIQNTSAEEENYQGDLDDEASFYSGFKVDKEDIVTEESNSSKLPPPVPTVNSSSLLPSQPLDVLFIERKDGGFKKEQKNNLAQTTVINHQASVDIPREPTISDFAMATQRTFKTFALFCHGLLAGFALCQCLFVYSLSSHSGGADNFLSNYYRLAQPIGSVYYFMLAVCTVSVLDSYGMVKTKLGFCHEILSNPLWTLSLIVYVLALIFTLSVAMIDDRISLYSIDPSLWENEKDKEGLVDDWKIVNLMRVIGAILGWILLAWQPGKDYSDVSLFDEQATTELSGPPGKNHLPGCNVAQIPQCVGYKDISP